MARYRRRDRPGRTRDLTAWAEQSDLCRRAVTVPGIGPHDRDGGRRGRRGRPHVLRVGATWRRGSASFRASTRRAGKPTLGRISKRGNTYLRELFIQGAQSSFLYLKRDQSSLGQWLRQVEARCHRQVAVVALANKMVRICWKVLTSEQVYQPYPARVA